MIPTFHRTLRPVPLVVGGIILAFVGLGIWAYWPTFQAMGFKWFQDPQYSHGYLVPAFALVLLWLRRSLCPLEGPVCNWWCLPFFAVGLLLRLAGAFMNYDWVDAVSLLPCLAGVAVLLGGWPALRWTWPAIGFLVFMIPLPFFVETALSHPLQQIATYVTTYVMQTLGVAVLAEGNTILVPHGPPLEIAGACSGLSMMLSFFALSTAVVILIKRPWLDQAVILLSAVPIAVMANVARITITGMLQVWWSPEIGSAFHNRAGWVMMLLALGLLMGELWVLSRLLIERPAKIPVGGAFPHVPGPTPSAGAHPGSVKRSWKGKGVPPPLPRK